MVRKGQRKRESIEDENCDDRMNERHDGKENENCDYKRKILNISCSDGSHPKEQGHQRSFGNFEGQVGEIAARIDHAKGFFIIFLPKFKIL